MTKKERQRTAAIAWSVYYERPCKLRRDTVSRIEREAKVTRAYARTLYNRLSTAETAQYASRVR